MSNIGLTNTYNAVRTLCAHWKASLPPTRFSTIFDKGEPEFADPPTGNPWVSMRYTGPQDDGAGGLGKAKVPRYLTFAIRIYHTPDPFPGDGGDSYLAAQDLCLRGESDFEEMIANDPTAGGIILDCLVLDGVAGDMEDEGGGQWFGHELLVTVHVH